MQTQPSFTIEFKRTHSSERAKAIGLAPDRHQAMVMATEFRADGSSYPMLHYVAEARRLSTARRAAEEFIATQRSLSFE